MIALNSVFVESGDTFKMSSVNRCLEILFAYFKFVIMVLEGRINKEMPNSRLLVVGQFERWPLNLGNLTEEYSNPYLLKASFMKRACEKNIHF